MFKERLEFISDGIFAIVMTLLVIEIKVPETEELLHHFSNAKLWDALTHLYPLFLSFFLSFAVLTTFWVSHNFLITINAKNATRELTYLNLLFLSFVSLVPFSSHLLGAYPGSALAVAFYSANVLIISLLFNWMRIYVIKSDRIQNNDLSSFDFTAKDRFYGRVRNWVYVACPAIALVVSFVSTQVAIGLLLIPIVIGVVPGSLAFILRITGIDRLAEEVNNQTKAEDKAIQTSIE